MIKTTGACITECFAKGNGNNCYRFGGDEFVVILRDCPPQEINSKIDHFVLAAQREKICVAVGYAYSETVDDDTFKTLLAEADKKMYEQKKRAHGLSDSDD